MGFLFATVMAGQSSRVCARDLCRAFSSLPLHFLQPLLQGDVSVSGFIELLFQFFVLLAEHLNYFHVGLRQLRTWLLAWWFVVVVPAVSVLNVHAMTFRWQRVHTLPVVV